MKTNTKFENTRVLVTLGKENINAVIPLFITAFETAQLNRDATLWHATMFELIELGKKHPALVIACIKKTLRNYHPYSLRYEPTRVLVEIGRTNPREVSLILKKILNTKNDIIVTTTICEIAELSQIHPDIFSPLLGEVLLHHDNPHAQWTSALAIANLTKTHSQQVTPILQKVFPLKKRKNKTLSPKLKHQRHLNHAKYIKIFKEGNETKQWKTILEMIDVAHNNFEAAIPILQQALESQDQHVQWAANLTLIHLIQHQQEAKTSYLATNIQNRSTTLTNHAVKQKINHTNSSLQHITLQKLLQTSTITSKNEHHRQLNATTKNNTTNIVLDRIIPQLSKNLQSDMLEIFPTIFQNDSIALQITATYELFEMLEGNFLKSNQIIKILQQLFSHRNSIQRTQQIRLLPEIGKNNPKLVNPILQKAITSNDVYLKIAATKELFALRGANTTIVQSPSNNNIDSKDCATTPQQSALKTCKHIDFKRQCYSHW